MAWKTSRTRPSVLGVQPVLQGGQIADAFLQRLLGPRFVLETKVQRGLQGRRRAAGIPLPRVTRNGLVNEWISLSSCFGISIGSVPCRLLVTTL